MPSKDGARTYRGKRTGRVIREADASASKRTSGARPGSLFLPRRAGTDFTIIACVVLLLMMGIIMVASSSYYYAYTTLDDSMHFVRRQIIWVGVGLLAMLLVAYAPLRLIRRSAVLIYAASVFFCILVLFVGTTVNGSTRWLGVGTLSFQPAELAKLGVAIYMAVLVEQNLHKMQDIKVFIRLLLVTGIPAALVAYQNLTSGIIIGFIGVVILFLGGARLKHFVMVLGPVAAFALLILIFPLIVSVESMPGFMRGFMEEFMYRSLRVRAWVDPFEYALDEGYQTVQSLYAVASGGLFGRGLGQSIQKLGPIPEAYNDIIFAIICEELGLFGAALTIILFGIFAWEGIKISYYAPNKFTQLLSAGIVMQISFQAIMNVAVNTNLVPASGVTLPFISYGGSSVLFLMSSVGLLLNISAYSRRVRAEEPSVQGPDSGSASRRRSRRGTARSEG